MTGYIFDGRFLLTQIWPLEAPRSTSFNHYLGNYMKRLVAILAFFTMFGTSAADLTGTVSFKDGLYTYSYELSASDYVVSEVLVMIRSNGGDFDLHPISFTSPDNWAFNTYVGVNPNYADLIPAATYFGWGLRSPGSTSAVSGFSFTTDAPPAAAPLPITYMLFAPEYQGGRPPIESFYLGSVLAPDSLAVLPPSPVPEPQMYVMLLAGIGLLGYAAKRKAKTS